MFRFIANIKIRNKLLLLLLIPIASLVFFSVNGLLEKARLTTDMAHLKNLSELAVKISEAVHELQKERGESALYIGSQGSKFKEELREQRSDTDKKIAALNDFIGEMDRDELGDDLSDTLDQALGYLKKIEVTREDVGSLGISAAEAFESYTTANSSLLHVIDGLSKSSVDAKLAVMMSSYSSLLREKEMAGQERAVLSNAFAKDKFDTGMLNRLVAITAAQDIYEQLFLSSAVPRHKDYFAKEFTGKFIDETSRMRKIALVKGDEGDFGVDPAQWFKMQTGRVNILKDVEDEISRDLYLEAERLKDKAQSEFIFFLGLTITAILASVFFSFLITRSITAPMSKAVEAANRLAEGDTSVVIEADSKDETGELLRALGRTVRSLDEISASADRIANKDLTVEIVPNSEKDVLGNALAGMVDNLREQIRNIAEMSEVLSTSSAEMATASAQLAATTQETATSVNETITTVEEVKQTAELANEKSTEVADNSEQIEKISQAGEESVSKTFDVMHRIREQTGTISESIITLSEQSQMIGEIISTVNDLAEQSNLLAVNATIEAAKAGEQGKGFAVVAQEIKSLSVQSKEATMQVRDLLTDIQKAIGSAVMATEQGSKEVDFGVQQSTEAAEAIKALAENVREGALIAKQIAASSSQQLVGMDQITTAMHSIGQANQQNLDAAKNFEKSTQELNAAGNQLKHTVDEYTL